MKSQQYGWLNKTAVHISKWIHLTGPSLDEEHQAFHLLLLLRKRKLVLPRDETLIGYSILSGLSNSNKNSQAWKVPREWYLQGCPSPSIYICTYSHTQTCKHIHIYTKETGIVELSHTIKPITRTVRQEGKVFLSLYLGLSQKVLPTTSPLYFKYLIKTNLQGVPRVS